MQMHLIIIMQNYNLNFLKKIKVLIFNNLLTLRLCKIRLFYDGTQREFSINWVTSKVYDWEKQKVQHLK